MFKDDFREKACYEMIILLAGVYAESKYTGENVYDLMKAGGRSDMAKFTNMVEVFAQPIVLDLKCKTCLKLRLHTRKN